MKRKALLSPLIIIILIIIFGVGIAGAAIYLGNSGDANTLGINLQKGLVGWWKFDGNAKDSTPYGSIGTVTGATLDTDRKGQVSRSYNFNGSSDFISETDNDSLEFGTGNFTISLWAKFNALPANGTHSPFVSRYVNGTNFWWFSVYNNGGSSYMPHFYGFKGGVNFNNSVTLSSLSSGVWHHFLVNRTGSSVNFYFDGAFVATSGGTNSEDLTYASALFIGKSDGSGTFFNGNIDDVRAYNRALSSAEVTALYQEYDPGIQISDLQKGLVGYWKFDGNAKDFSPYGNNGTVTGAIFTTDRKGAANKAYSFDGASDVNVGNGASLNLTSAVTVSAWVKPSSVGALQIFLSKSDITGTIRPFELWLQATGKFGFADYDGSWHIDTNDNVVATAGNYYHVVGAYNGATMTTYVNAIPSSGTALSSMASSPGSLWIGGWLGMADFFSGSIDDVRIYNRALSATEVTALYNEYDPGIQVSNLQKGLVGHWKFDGNAKDFTPYGNNGTVTGATLTTDRKGQVNKSYNFNGSSYIDAGSGASLDITSNITVGAWIYWRGATSETIQEIASKGSWGFPGARAWDWGINKSNALLKFHDGSAAEFYSTVAIPQNTWTHVVFTVANANSLKYYINGVLDNTQTIVFTDYDRNLTIGMSDRVSDYFDGVIDDVRIYNRALTQTEITALYESY